MTRNDNNWGSLPKSSLISNRCLKLAEIMRVCNPLIRSELKNEQFLKLRCGMSALRLVPSPTPGQLRAHPTPMPIARLGDAVFPRTLAAVIRGRGSARSAPPPPDGACSHARQNMPSPTPRTHCSRGLAGASADGPARLRLPVRGAAGHDAPRPPPRSAHAKTREAPTREVPVGAAHAAGVRHPTAAGRRVARATASGASTSPPGDCARP